ncbi:FAD/NAD(P)-binding oxidoreductase [Parafrigoribacterium mesophilum]|uniref:FAD/NAD(P)-binding oxidoreductase n=1 Tax=Parafrigoribacterium mesophilum TaxID=433646 RepID=UPI0031FBDF3D
MILVIGAGPAGLAAAAAARRRGVSVTILDSSDQLGGQFWRHLPMSRPAAREHLLHHGWDTFTTLRDVLVADAGCRIIRRAQVWAIEPREVADGGAAVTVHVVVGSPDGAGRENLNFVPDAVVLATGAHDRTLPFPGWDLPGVFTGGAAQALAKGERIAVGRRVVVAGAGPFLLPVAASLAGVGAHVLGVFEANSAAALLRGWLPKPWRLIPAAAKAVELAGYAAGQLRHRIPYRPGRAVIAAHGTDRVESVTVAALTASWSPIPGTERAIAVDAVCVSHGFTPRLELAIAAGCDLTADRFVRVDASQLTSIAGVYAAGEITGIGGVDLALAEGQIAGHAAAGGRASDPERRATMRRRRVFQGFAARIEAAHGIRAGWRDWLTDDTIVCRCEEVGYGSLCRSATGTGSQSLRTLKLATRAGLGICQGRICGRSVEELLAASAPGGALTDGTLSDRRPIAAPLRIGELASLAHSTDRQTPDQQTPQQQTTDQTRSTHERTTHD